MRWNADPVLLAVLTVSVLASWRAFRTDPRRQLLFLGGWVLLAAAFASPLRNLGVALFSARATQHVIVALFAAPLLAAAFTLQRMGAWRVAPPSAAFTLVLWFWHAPAPLDATLANNIVYWAMHLSILGSALWLWSAILGEGGFPAFLAVTFAGLHMSALGALLVFARSPLYSVYRDTTAPWGLTPLQDQQLGALLMWVPAGLLITTWSAFALTMFLRVRERVTNPLEARP
ncbi:putative membrane protein [Rhodoblastus acidophilus]|uniref:cytochrome c oxidase assembly protein n=1 Tax=Rhodoblastus acidophilus TaxID=1074 RepID=UPI0022242D75|nr:cytochrome c oxidase assembly protein [Rhodoblastus acidophilus]MCW2283993.1 putative membrane protein [Rhodoblastus acidophilus]MCW2332689.1 putative membrane protein [Rhodoblastus acidophilus]